MKSIRAYVSMDEVNKVRYYRDFEIKKELPVVGEEFGSHFGDGIEEVVKEVKEVRLDCEQGSDEVYEYDFFTVKTEWKEDEELSEVIYYYAIYKESEY